MVEVVEGFITFQTILSYKFLIILGSKLKFYTSKFETTQLDRKILKLDVKFHPKQLSSLINVG